MAVPKKWQCLECGSKSNRSQNLNMGFVGFARCYKCFGKLKETEKWLKWYEEETIKFFAQKK